MLVFDAKGGQELSRTDDLDVFEYSETLNPLVAGDEVADTGEDGTL